MIRSHQILGVKKANENSHQLHSSPALNNKITPEQSDIAHFNFIWIVFQILLYEFLSFASQINDADKDVWLQGSNRKWKVEIGRIDTKCRSHANNVCSDYDIVRGYSFTVSSFVVGEEKALSSLKRKLHDISRRLYPVKLLL